MGITSSSKIIDQQEIPCGGQLGVQLGLSAAASLFDPSSSSGQIIVMFTDGKTTAGPPPAPVAAAGMCGCAVSGLFCRRMIYPKVKASVPSGFCRCGWKLTRLTAVVPAPSLTPRKTRDTIKRNPVFSRRRFSCGYLPPGRFAGIEEDVSCG